MRLPRFHRHMSLIVLFTSAVCLQLFQSWSFAQQDDLDNADGDRREQLPGSMQHSLFYPSLFGREQFKQQVNQSFDRLDNFDSSVVVTFAEQYIGRFPRIKDGEMENGGIPQRAAISEHATDVALKIDELPANFSGLVVFDYESWSPVWQMNRWNDRLVAESWKYTAERLGRVPTEAEVIEDFERSAREFIEVTIKTARLIRSDLQYGFYDWPGRNWTNMSDEEYLCRYRWFGDLVDVLCPSYYAKRRPVFGDAEPGEHEEKAIHVRRRLDRELQFRRSFGLPVLVFFTLNHEYLDREDSDPVFLSRPALELYAESLAPYADGLILWQWVPDQKHANLYSDYIETHFSEAVPMLNEIWEKAAPKRKEFVPTPGCDSNEQR